VSKPYELKGGENRKEHGVHLLLDFYDKAGILLSGSRPIVSSKPSSTKLNDHKEFRKGERHSLHDQRAVSERRNSNVSKSLPLNYGEPPLQFQKATNWPH